MRMKGKLIKGLALTLTISSMWSMTALAGEWKLDSSGWWYQNDDGSYPKEQWQEIGGQYYYFKPDGYMLADSMTPDGYYVDTNGVWVQSDEQFKAVNEYTISFLTGFANSVHNIKSDYNPVDINISVSNIDAASRAYLLYYYQYFSQDSRFILLDEYNLLSEADMTDIMDELFTDDAAVNESAVRYFIQNYTRGTVNQEYKVNSTADFGDAGSYYFSNATYTFENGLLKISGDVVVYSSETREYIPRKSFTAYFNPGDGKYYDGYCFSRLVVE